MPALTYAASRVEAAEVHPARRMAVIGGGMLGMALTHRLVRAGVPVSLFESSPSLGGLAGAWSLSDVVWDRHYHATSLSDASLRRLLAELGLENSIEWVETRTGVYADGETHSMSSTLEFLRFPSLGLIDRLRLGATILYASRVKNWKRLEKIRVADWLRRLSGERTFQKLWLPLLRSKLGDSYKKTSAAFIWATIARMNATRQSSLTNETFGYIPGGYARITERFEESLRADGVQVQVGAPVVRVESNEGLVEVILGDGSYQRFGQVILTLPGPVVNRLCPELTREEKIRFGGVRYQGVICASVLLKRPLGGYFVTNITDPDIPFTAVIEMSSLVDRRHFGGQTLVYLPKYMDSEDRTFEATDAEIRRRFMRGLRKMYPELTDADVACFRVSRARHVHPLSTLDYSDALPPVVTSVTGVRVVNSAQIINGTLNVNETVRLAEEHARLVLTHGLAAWNG